MKQLFTALLLICATAVTAQSFEVDGIKYKTNSTGVTFAAATVSGDFVIPEKVSITSLTIPACGLSSNTDGTSTRTNYFYAEAGTVITLTYTIRLQGSTSACAILDGVKYYCNTPTYSGTATCTIEVETTGIHTLEYSLRNNEYGVSIGFSVDSFVVEAPFEYTVTRIGNSAFNGCKELTSVEIPNSVTTIGNSVFDGCSSLTDIEIPNSVTSIGGSAFEDCSSLTSISIGS